MFEIVYVLTLSFFMTESVSLTCEDKEETYYFARAMDCVALRKEIVDSYQNYHNVYVYEDKTYCDAVGRPLPKGIPKDAIRIEVEKAQSTLIDLQEGWEVQFRRK